MKRYFLILTLMIGLWHPAFAVIDTLIPPTSANAGASGTISTISAAAVSGNFSQDRNCLINLSVDSTATNFPCQFVVYDGALNSGTTIWSVIVTTNAPSAIETWQQPVPGLPVMDLCGTRGNTMLIRTTCNSADASYNGFTDK